MNVHFRFRFVFDRIWNTIFVGIFVHGRKCKMPFGRPVVYGLGLEMQSFVLGLEHYRLGLGLGLERILFSLGLGLDLGLEKSLDYISASGTRNVISSAYLNIGLSFNLEREYESAFIAAYSVR